MANEVTTSTLYTNTFKSIYTLLNTYKVSSTYIYAGNSNEETIKYPNYIINSAEVNPVKQSMKYGINDYDISIEIEMWVKVENGLGKAKIDEMKQSVFNLVNSHYSELSLQNLEPAENWYDETNTETVEFNDVRYHTAAVMLMFKLI